MLTILFWAVLIVAAARLYGGLRGVFDEALEGGAYRHPAVRELGAGLLAGLTTLVAAGLVVLIVDFSGREGRYLGAVVGGGVALVVLLRAWQAEFLALMARRDDEFPGRFDKLIWAVALLAFAPVCVWFFRSYRKARWGEPESAAAAEPAAKPGPDLGVAPDAL